VTNGRGLIFSYLVKSPVPVLILPVSSYYILTTILLELPVSIIERADLASLQPAGDAVEVEGVIADTPSYSTFLTSSGCLVCLTFNT